MPASVPKTTRSVPQISVADDIIAIKNAASLVPLNFMAAGSGIAVEAGDVTLLRNDLSAVAAAIRLSKATVQIMRQNLFWAFCYNAAGIPIAAFGLLNPIVASAAMALSSLSVLANSLRLRRFE